MYFKRCNVLKNYASLILIPLMQRLNEVLLLFLLLFRSAFCVLNLALFSLLLHMLWYCLMYPYQAQNRFLFVHSICAINYSTNLIGRHECFETIFFIINQNFSPKNLSTFAIRSINSSFYPKIWWIYHHYQIRFRSVCGYFHSTHNLPN